MIDLHFILMTFISSLRGRESLEGKEQEKDYHNVEIGADTLRAAHPQLQLARSVTVKLEERFLTAVSVSTGDCSHHGSDRLSSLHHTGVKLQRLSHPPP